MGRSVWLGSHFSSYAFRMWYHFGKNLDKTIPGLIDTFQVMTAENCNTETCLMLCHFPHHEQLTCSQAETYEAQMRTKFKSNTNCSHFQFFFLFFNLSFLIFSFLFYFLQILMLLFAH